MKLIKLVSLNVRGLRGDKRNTVFNWLHLNKFNISLLQETYCTSEFISKFKKGWDGNIYHCTSDSKHSRGVCVLFDKELDYTILNIHTDESGRLILINVRIEGNEYTIVNLYSPNKVTERVMFFQKVIKWINMHAISKNNLLIGGDFNCVDCDLDKTSSSSLDKSSKYLTTLKDTLCIIDSWRALNPQNSEYTFIDPSFRARNSRIDLWLTSKAVTANTKSCTIVQAPAPDHKAVCVELTVKKKSRGKGYWKMNNEVIDEKDFKDGIKQLYDDVVNEYGNEVSRCNLWEYLKIKIKQFTISYCIKRTMVKKDSVKSLEQT